MPSRSATPGWVKAFSWGTAPADEDEARAYLQRRLALFAFVVFLLSALFFAILAGLDQVSARPLSGWGIGSFDPAHAAGSLLAGLVWLIFRTGKRSLAAAKAGDIACSVGVCTCWTGMMFSAQERVHVEFVVLIPVWYLLIFRGAIVPSEPRRSLGISLVVSVVLTVGTYLTHLRGAELHPASDRFTYAAMTFAWSIMGVIVTTVCSHVVYGLRRQALEARQLGQYHLVERIGEGGMGIVYRARHATLRRPTAVKMLARLRTDESNIARFEREVQLTSQLSHPNTVDIYDYGRTPDGVFYYAMEFLDGPTLDELVKAFGPVPPARTIHLLSQVCGALAEAHAMGLVHRDIKPANIILTSGPGAHDLPKVVDFGLVKDVQSDDVNLTREGAVTGTPMYLPPEAISGAALDGRSDLYALGAVGYCLLTAKPVFDGDTVVAVCSQHLTETPESPSKRLGQSLPADLEGIILQCLAKDPADRPAGALALRALLDGCEDAGRWTPTDAQAWWDEHAEQIDGLHRDAAESLTTGGRTIDIDFARRGVRSSR